MIILVILYINVIGFLSKCCETEHNLEIGKFRKKV